MRWTIMVLSFLYFLQGMPYGIQIKFLPIILRKHGVSLSKISLFKLLFLPWVFKLLWAPLVDRYGTKKRWLACTTALLSVVCLLTAFIGFYDIRTLAFMLLLQNLCVSVQDISVDALAVSILATEDVGLGNVAQVTGYKVGGVIAGVVYMMIHSSLGHGVTYIGLALVYLLALLLIHNIDLQNLEYSRPSSDGTKPDIKQEANNLDGIHNKDGSIYISTLTEALNVKGTYWMVAYTCLYKCGENGSIALLPLLLLDNGQSDTKVAFCTGFVGSLTTIFGSLCGGLVLKRYSAHKASYILNIARCTMMVCIAILVNLWLLAPPGESRYDYADMLIVCCCLQLYLSGISSILTFTWMMQLSQNAPAHTQSTHYTTLATSEILGKLMFSAFIGYIPEVTSYIYTFYILLGAVVIITGMTCSTPRYLRVIGQSGEDNK